MSWAPRTIYIDCPGCGAGAASHLTFVSIAGEGADLRCACCGLSLWEGVVVARGRELTPDTVARRVRALCPELSADEAYTPPEDRAIVLGVARSRYADDRFTSRTFLAS